MRAQMMTVCYPCDNIFEVSFDKRDLRVRYRARSDLYIRNKKMNAGEMERFFRRMEKYLSGLQPSDTGFYGYFTSACVMEEYFMKNPAEEYRTCWQILVFFDDGSVLTVINEDMRYKPDIVKEIYIYSLKREIQERMQVRR